MQSILCSRWLMWALMGLGGGAGFLITRKRTKKGLVKAGASAGGIAAGYVAWLFLSKMCQGQQEQAPQFYDEEPWMDDEAYEEQAPYERQPGSGTATGQRPGVPPGAASGSDYSTPDAPPRTPVSSARTPTRTPVNPALAASGAAVMTGSRTIANSMFSGAYGS